MTNQRSFARRLALIGAGAAFVLGGIATSASALDIANPEGDDDCVLIDQCVDDGPQPEDPETPNGGFDGPGDITDDPCNHISHGCDDDGDNEPEIDDLAPEAPVPADPTFTG